MRHRRYPEQPNSDATLSPLDRIQAWANFLSGGDSVAALARKISAMQKAGLLRNTSLEDALGGDIILGKTSGTSGSEIRFGFTNEDLTKPFVIIGTMGTGKTTLIYIIIVQLRCSFKAFDLKSDYIHLTRVMGKDPDFIVIHVNDLRINPLEPPKGVEFENWVKQSELVFADAMKVERSVKILSQHARRIYGETGEVPSLFDAYVSIVENMPPRSSVAGKRHENVLDALTSLLDALPDTFACRRGVSSELLRKKAVIKFDSANNDSRAVLISMWRYDYDHQLANEPQNKGYPDMMIIVDEAQAFLGVQNFRTVDNLVTDELFRTGRGANIGIIASTQQAKALTSTVRDTAGNRIICGLASPEELQYMSGSMGLTQELEEKALSLEVWEHIVKKASGFQDAILINTPDFPMKKDMKMDEVRAANASKLAELNRNVEPVEEALRSAVIAHIRGDRDAIKRLRVERIEVSEPAEKSKQEPKPEPEPIMDRLHRQVTEKIVKKSKPGDLDLSGKVGKMAKRILESMLEEPFLNTTGRMEMLGISDLRIWYDAVKLLKNEGFVKGENVYRQGTLLAPMKVFIARFGQTYKGRGSFEHCYWQWRIAQRFKGSIIEDGYCDVSMVEDSKLCAVQIELTKTNVISNLRRNLSEGYARIYILYTKKNIGSGLVKAIEEEFGTVPGNVEIINVLEFLDRKDD